MNILLIKTSSLGDVVHALPAATDIRRHFPHATIDWVVEAPFAAIPRLHPAVRNVIPISIRRWRTSLGKIGTREEIGAFRADLKTTHYDRIIDCQGLMKSALIALIARGPRHGFDFRSAREGAATFTYRHRHAADWSLHAIMRNRTLVAKSLGYMIDEPFDYGIPALHDSTLCGNDKPYCVLLHSASHRDKLWPEADWIKLGQALNQNGLRCVLPWGTEPERARSSNIATTLPDAIVPEHMALNRIAGVLANAACVIGVDTGLTHLAAAVNAPVIGIYTSTAPAETGVCSNAPAHNLGSIGKAPAWADVFAAAAKIVRIAA